MSDSHQPPPSPRHPLIIVCCHAIYLGKPVTEHTNYDVPHDPYNEENWLLKSFQRSRADKVGEHVSFIGHIQRAVEIANRFKSAGADPTICFSGGPTHSVTRVSEAEGYQHVYEFFYAKGARRVLIENCATDSYQNVLFSLVRYFKETGQWPDHITLVTHEFKARRFMDLHLKAIRWPEGAATVEGLDPVFSDKERATVEASEARCYEEWKRDLYGWRPSHACTRNERLWDESRLLTLAKDCPALEKLLHWDGGGDMSAVFPDELPWDSSPKKSSTRQ